MTVIYSKITKKAGQAAIKGERIKIGIYEECSKDYIFVPLAVETFGSWGPIGLNFVKDIGRKMQEKTGQKNATSHIIKQSQWGFKEEMHIPLWAPLVVSKN